MRYGLNAWQLRGHVVEQYFLEKVTCEMCSTGIDVQHGTTVCGWRVLAYAINKAALASSSEQPSPGVLQHPVSDQGFMVLLAPFWYASLRLLQQPIGWQHVRYRLGDLGL